MPITLNNIVLMKDDITGNMLGHIRVGNGFHVSVMREGNRYEVGCFDDRLTDHIAQIICDKWDGAGVWKDVTLNEINNILLRLGG